MAFIIVENPEDNIWEANPSLELISGFRAFKNKEGVERSSNIIKAIYYIYDPKSELRDSGVPFDQLIEDITNNVIGDPDFDWNDYDDIKELYMSNNITALEAKLLDHEKEMEDLKTFLSTWALSKKDIKDRMVTMSAYNKLLDEYIDIREKVKMETEEMTEMLGGYQKSLIESFGNE